ncbi:MAG: glycosyltransferase family 39 protein [Kiritimatiellae bacterium]|nr:glycosyltransferase family 39 protein [Kiritimatiellia bacterium]
MGAARTRRRRLRRETLAVLAVLLASGVVLCVSAARMPLCREQELRVALTARTMAQSGGWLRPEYRGTPRYQKPPLMYWLTALTYRAARTTRVAAIARLPGLAFALGLLALIYAGGRRLVGRRGAALATAFAAGSYAMLRFGFRAEGDIAQSFWTAAAVFGAGHALRAPPRAWWWWLAAGAAAGAGMLAKSPAPPAILLLTAASAAALHAPLRRGLAQGLLLAIAGAAALALPWYAVALFGPASEAAGRALASEMSALMRRPTHPGPWFYYLYALPAALAPWSLALPAALARLARRVRGRAREALLAGWLLAALLLLSAMRNKQIHYTTLLLPPAALALGGWAARVRTRRAAGALTFYGRAIALTLLLAGTVSAVAAPALRAAGWPTAIALGLALTVAGTAAWRAAEHAPHIPAPAALAGILLAALTLSGPWAPWIENEHILVPFANRLAERLSAETTVWVAGDDDGALEFHLGRPVRTAPAFETAWAAAAPGDVVVVAATDHAQRFPDRPAPLCEVRHRAHRVAAYLRAPATLRAPR